ncbi:proteasome endopeptidase complex [Anaeramoeba ignava]|uniref:Proteasome endopeptidase complex n=1 Tax=Anaeramoeba ignava TaxID=1746090 RepID=A0A9Q0R3X3_ANAIG|nr:proteasome endopeptidase complex [Anaeramoeba ignava]
MQIEHALRAVNKGGTALGIKASNGVVIVTEKKLPTPLIDESSIEKISVITETIGMVYAGVGPDFRLILRKARRQAELYKLRYHEPIPVSQCAREIANIMQEYTQSGGVRPFGISLLVAGYDHNGPQLYQVDPSGSFWAWKASSIGKNSDNAKTFLEKRYSDSISLEDAINTAILTLKEGFEGEMDENNIEIGIVDENKKFKCLKPSEIADYLNEIGD